MSDRPIFTDDGDLRLLDAVRRLTKEGARAEASAVTTYSVNFPFYEDVMLRLFERAGCRLNILMVDVRQLAKAMADPLQRPRRAGRDYVLAPIAPSGLSHSKLLALFADKRSMLAVGSHNSTEAGFARNREATVCWGYDGTGVPSAVMADAADHVSHWLASSPGFDPGIAGEVSERLRRLCPPSGSTAPDAEARFLGYRRGGPSLLQQFSGLLRGRAKRLLILGPFFDAELAFVRETARLWTPHEIIAAIQPDTVSLLQNEPGIDGLTFVDAAALAAASPADAGDPPPGGAKARQRKDQYLHAKILAVETTEGLWLAIGSANPSAPAWMQDTAGNAEAVVALSGTPAREAFDRLNLGRLADARPVTAGELAEAAHRTRAEIQTADATGGPQGPVRMAFVTPAGISLPGIAAEACVRAVDLAEGERPIATAEFIPVPDGTELTLGEDGAGAHLLRIDGGDGPLTTLILHSLAKLRGGTRPKVPEHILEGLGKLDDFSGDLDALLGLVDKYIFADLAEQSGTSQSAPSPRGDGAIPAADAPFGPRGVSLEVLAKKGLNPRSIVEFELSEIISILIRDLTEARPNDGDAPNFDVEDADGRRAAPNPDEDEEDHPEVNWERLVAACRRRIGTMVNKLRQRLTKPVSNLNKATWLFGRMLTIMTLLRKLRERLPPNSKQAGRQGRPESLVSVAQLRSVFKGCMDALYRPEDGIARWIESSADHRIAGERALLDVLLLWAAREIGADLDAQPLFGETADERTSRLCDKADAVVAAMSAAAHPDLVTDLIKRAGTVAWRDAAAVAPGWWERHVKFGGALQAVAACSIVLPTRHTAATTGDVVVRKAEPGFPRVVCTAVSDKAALIGPGAENGRQAQMFKQSFLAPIDMTRLMSVAAAGQWQP